MTARRIAEADTKFYVSNLNADNLAVFTKKAQRVFGNNEPLYINMLGDSTTIGIGGILSKFGPPAQLAARFAERGIPASSNRFGLYSSAAATTTLDPRIVFTGTWAGWTALPGGPSMRCTVDGGTVAYTPTIIWDVMDVYWYRDTTGTNGGGNMVITVDAGATNFSTPTSGGSVSTQTISQTGAGSVQKTTVTAASLGTHSLTVTRNDATNHIQMYGFEPRNSAVGTVLIRDAGFTGYTSTNWNVSTLNNALLNANLLSQLTLWSIGVNDWANSIVLATYVTNIAATLSNVAANGSPSVMLWTPPPSSVSTAAITIQQTYVDALIAAGGTTMVIADLWRRYQDRGGQAKLASAVDGYYNDLLHPNAWGNYELSRFLYEAVMWSPR